MANEMTRLIVSLEARTQQFNRALEKANKLSQQQLSRIESRFTKANRRVLQGMAGIGKGWIAGIVAGIGVRELGQLSDVATRIDNALKIAGLSGGDLENVYGKLRDSAVANAAPLEALVELYSRAALVQKELGVSSEQLLGFTDNISVALRVSGKSAAESSGALLQLSQALGSGVVRAEEFNSILEGAPTILQAAAAGIKEAEGSVSKLRKIMLDGELSSRALFDGIAAGAPVLEQKLSGATFTIAQSLTNLQTSLYDAAREFNAATGASERFAGGINNVAKVISDFDVAGFINKIQQAGGALDEFAKSIANSGWMEQFAEFMTGKELTVGQPIAIEKTQAENDIASLERQIEILRQRIEANKEMAIDTTEASAQLAGLLAQVNAINAATAAAVTQAAPVGTPGNYNSLASQPISVPKAVNPISIKDPIYKATGAKTGGGGGKSKQSEFAREVEQIKERTAAIQAETAAMAGLNPLVANYGMEVEKARAKAELLSAAQKAGIAITPELEAKIEALAGAYATASSEAEKLSESQEKAKATAEEFSSLGKDVLGGFIRDLREGKSASEALANALNKVADKLLDIALNALFEGGGGLGGIFSFIPKLFGLKNGGFVHMAGGGRVRGPGGPRGDKIPAMLSDGEHVTNARSAKKYGPLLDAINGDRVSRLAAGGWAAPSVPSVSRYAATANDTGPREITIHVVGEEGPMFRPTIQAESRDVAVRVTRAGISQYDSGLSHAFAGKLANAQARQM